MTHVPYRGGAPMQQDMVAGNTSPERKAALHAALTRVLQQPEVHATLSKATAGPVPEPLAQAEAEAFYQEQIRQLRTAIQATALEAN